MTLPPTGGQRRLSSKVVSGSKTEVSGPGTSSSPGWKLSEQRYGAAYACRLGAHDQVDCHLVIHAHQALPVLGGAELPVCPGTRGTPLSVQSATPLVGPDCDDRLFRSRARRPAPIDIQELGFPAPSRPCLRPHCTGAALCAVTRPMNRWPLEPLMRWPAPPGGPGGPETGPL